MTCERLGDELGLYALGFIHEVILNSEFCLLTPSH